MLTSDRLALMSGGRILQTGSPRDCYLDPASLEAARLLGEVNALPIAAGRTAFGPAPAADGVLMVRPEGLALGSEGAPARVAAVRFGGASVVVTLEAAGARADARVPLANAPAVGGTVHVRIDAMFARAFPSPSGEGGPGAQRSGPGGPSRVRDS
jgi:ABC-type Fe3+/spermidine/putrescine transport system ATPase subunit